MNSVTEDMKKAAKGVVCEFSGQYESAQALIEWSNYLIDLGRKLKDKSTDEQREKYKTLVNAYVVIRNQLAQNYIHEYEVWAHENNKKVYLNKINEQSKEIESLRKQIEFLK